MAATKLTLRMDGALIEGAKEIARNSGKSVSQLVADYFYGLTRVTETHEGVRASLPPVVQSLWGSWKGHEVVAEDYWRYLEEKHR